MRKVPRTPQASPPCPEDLAPCARNPARRCLNKEAMHQIAALPRKPRTERPGHSREHRASRKHAGNAACRRPAGRNTLDNKKRKPKRENRKDCQKTERKGRETNWKPRRRTKRGSKRQNRPLQDHLLLTGSAPGRLQNPSLKKRRAGKRDPSAAAVLLPVTRRATCPAPGSRPHNKRSRRRCRLLRPAAELGSAQAPGDHGAFPDAVPLDSGCDFPRHWAGF